MPSNKNQHFVPRCHMRLFSLDQQGDAINIFNLKRESAIGAAPAKNQCSRDYFYGKDGTLEKILQNLEGKYAAIVRKITCSERPIEKEFSFLRDFMFFQSRRTETAAQILQVAGRTVNKAIVDGKNIESNRFKLSEREAMILSMKAWVDGRKYIGDLKVLLIKNLSNVDFITSDHPSIITNKYFYKKFGTNTFGLMNSGVVQMMPLSPSWYVISYDRSVYSVTEKATWYLEITSDLDAKYLNELQYLQASQNIYFYNWEDRNRIEQEFKTIKNRRPDSWYKVNVYISEGEDHIGEHFRTATEEERLAATQSLIRMGFQYPVPSMWLSKLKLRNSPKTYSSGSVVGPVRKREWLKGRHRAAK